MFVYLRVSAQRFEPGGFIETRRFRAIQTLCAASLCEMTSSLSSFAVASGVWFGVNSRRPVSVNSRRSVSVWFGVNSRRPVRHRKTQKTENSNLHGFEVHRPSSKGTKLLFQVIQAIMNQPNQQNSMQENFFEQICSRESPTEKAAEIEQSF